MDIFHNIFQGLLNTSFPELLAVIFGLLYIFLAANENIFCWLAGLLSSVIYIYVCFSAQLYLESVLSVFYSAMSVYGWLQWKKGNGDPEVAIHYSSFKQLFILVLIGMIVSPVIGYFVATHTHASQPYFDAAITTFSLIATWMVTKKIIENWLFWVVIDFASIILYANRNLYFSGLLFLIYTIISVTGYIKWKKIVKQAKNV